VIPHNQPTIGQAERDAAARVLASGWLAQGREVAAFENEVCEYLGLPSEHAVALSSGTAALFMALWALAARGKRVAIPVFSCAALRNAVVMAGAEPVAIDVAENSPSIDFAAALSSGAEVIVAAHLFGEPTRLEASHVPVIEDCAQAFGARIDGRAVGVNGTAGIFSFYATKMLTSGGQGGMVVSRDKSLVDAVRDYREFDCRRDRMPRFNLQMTDLQAAVGRAQLAQINDFLDRRRAHCARYAAAGLSLWHGVRQPGVEGCNYRAILRVAEPESCMARFAAGGVRAIVPIAEWELLDDAVRYPRAAILTRTTLSIPVHPALTANAVDAIIRAASPLTSELKPS